ncbi:MAG: hypothetical protein AAF630_15275 [Cyanobacteria bacterium P01_C01_bin.38]
MNQHLSIFLHLSRLSQQLTVTSKQLTVANYQLPITNYQLPITNYQLPITSSAQINSTALITGVTSI